MLIGGWDSAANWDVRCGAVREKPTMMEQCELLSVGLPVWEGTRGALSHPGNKTLCLWVLGGRRWESVSGVQITDSQWTLRFTGHKMRVSRRCCKSVRPTSSIPTPTITPTSPPQPHHPASQEDTPTQCQPDRDFSSPPPCHSSHVH